MNDRTDLATYYAKYAGTHEEVYRQPARQADLAVLGQQVREALRGHRVLEIACGAGYWTGQFAESAAAVLATDINPEMIELANAKGLPEAKVRFALADAYDLPPQSGFTACFIGFWWSHLKRQDQVDFLGALRARLGKDGLLVLIDDNYVEGESTPVARTDADGNTWQISTLPNGERQEVVKNYATDSALRKKMGPYVKDIRIARSTHYWMLTCRLK
jgi:SAM-dependent methyltransferase